MQVNRRPGRALALRDGAVRLDAYADYGGYAGLSGRRDLHHAVRDVRPPLRRPLSFVLAGLIFAGASTRAAVTTCFRAQWPRSKVAVA
jgi:hypothetical protein